MATNETTPASVGPRFAPDDPTLPKPWTGLIDGGSGVLYYWNPETNVTQYERPASTTTPPLPPGPPPSTSTPSLSPIPTVHSLTPNGSLQQQQPTQQMLHHTSQTIPQQVPQQAQPIQQLPLQQSSQIMQPPHLQQGSYGQTPTQNQQVQQLQQQSQQLHQTNQHVPQQQMQYPQFSYMQVQQTPNMQGLQTQSLQMLYQDRHQQVQGLEMQRVQGQQQQGSQIPQQGLQIQHQQELQKQGLQVPHQHGQQPLKVNLQYQHGQFPQVPQSTLQHVQAKEPQPQGKQFGQQAQLVKFPRAEDSSFQEGKQPGFSSPSVHQTPPMPGGSPPLHVPYPGAHSMHPPQRSRPSGNLQQSFPASAPLRQDRIEPFHQQHRIGGAMAPNSMGNPMVRPPAGLKVGFEDDNRPRTREELDMPRIPPNQPKLAPLPIACNQDMQVGPINSSFVPHAAGSNMFPGPSMHSLPNAGPIRPPLRMLGQPEFPHLSADAYCQHHEVTAMGDNVPAPFMTFEATGFPPEILREMHFAGFSSPTPIQAQTWPVALQGRDIVAIAKTGSGKTLGYLIPAFIHLKRCRNDPKNGPTVLVLAPTRELATQIQDEALKFGRSSRISCACVYGGASKPPQIKELERGADIVVATPGRLKDFIDTRVISLHQVSLLVLDEADRMLDMGFEPQIRGIVIEIPRHRQTLMYTATWPKEVRKIAGDLLVNPVQVNIGSVGELAANKSITQYVEVVPQIDRQRRLEQILRAQERGSKIIIFCSTKRLCDQLARSIGRSFGAAAIHGDKSQDERDRVLNEFRIGRAPILVATDVAARGLDIKDIRVVINYDFPTGIEDYVHRIGRTGRAGATGVSYTFFSDQDWKYAADLVKVLEGANQHVPPEIREMAARGGPVHPRGVEQPGINRWDSGSTRWEAAGRRGGMMRDGGGGRGVMRDGGGGRGMIRDGPGGFGGRGGGGRNDFYGGRGGRGGRSFSGPGGSGSRGRGRSDREPYDRYNQQDGRGRYENRRPYGDRVRDRSYSRSPERVRTWGYDRSRSRSSSGSRSRSRSWSRSRSRSGSRSRTRSKSPGYERYERPRVRVSGFDVRPTNETQPTPPLTDVLPQASSQPPLYKEEPVAPLFDAGQMSPMSPGRGNGSLALENVFHRQHPVGLPINPMNPNQHHPAGV